MPAEPPRSKAPPAIAGQLPGSSGHGGAAGGRYKWLLWGRILSRCGGIAAGWGRCRAPPPFPGSPRAELCARGSEPAQFWGCRCWGPGDAWDPPALGLGLPGSGAALSARSHAAIARHRRGWGLGQRRRAAPEPGDPLQPAGGQGLDKGDPRDHGTWSPDWGNLGSLEVLGPWTRGTHGYPGALKWAPRTGGTHGDSVTRKWGAQRRGTSGTARSPSSPERGIQYTLELQEARQEGLPEPQSGESREGNSWVGGFFERG